LTGGAETLWDYLQQARPQLARQRLHNLSKLQKAQLAQAEGESGEASGASSVVATLWRVEDNASAAFFQKFCLIC